jgi:CRP-like cAMP-binding protein
MIDARDLERSFSGLSPSILDRMAALGIPMRIGRNRTIFRAGDPADGLYIVASGRIRVSRETPDHVELLHTEVGGGLLGEIPVFGGGSFPATAVATEPTSVVKLPSAAVEILLSEYPEFARFALKRLAARAHSLLRRIDELTATTITGRLAEYMLNRSNGESEFTLGMSQAALAADLGTAREVVVRGIGTLIRVRAIRRVGRSRFSVVDEPTLRSLAGLYR